MTALPHSHKSFKSHRLLPTLEAVEGVCMESTGEWQEL